MAAEDAAGDPLTGSAPIGIVGAGRVAQALGRLLHDRGEPIAALTSRNQAHAAHAAAFIGSDVQVVDPSQLPRLVSRIIIAVSDDSIEATAGMLADAGIHGGVALHTCGARGPEALAPLRAAGVACGVLHPLQSIPDATRGLSSLEGVTFGVGGDAAALEWAERIVALLRGRSLRVNDGAFPAYHAGAVMAGNHLIAVVDAAAVLLGRAGISYADAISVIGPLCRTSLANALEAGPAAALTGPVARGDAGTVAVHLDAIAGAPESVSALYRAATGHLIDLARQRGLGASQVRQLQRLLEPRKAEDTDESHTRQNH